MRRAILASLAAAALAFGMAAPAAAHVHGVTPLNQCSVDNPNSGGLATDDTPASADNGGPISGLIPRDVGESPLDMQDGGFGATGDHCP